MGIIVRIIQNFEPVNENEFMLLEKKFYELERSRPDFPLAKRMQPISGREPMNSLIWQFEFANMETAYETLNYFKGDKYHEMLYKDQAPYIKEVKVEFFKSLEFGDYGVGPT